MVLGFPPSALGSRPSWRKWLSRSVATVLTACALTGAAQAGEQEPGYALKAGYLAKFTPFVDWPDAAFEGPTSPFHLCIGGHDPFGVAIDRVAGGCASATTRWW